MSELLYYTTAVTKGKKPKVMFLSDEMWIFNPNHAELMNLQESEKAAKSEPTHCLFVEAHDGLKTVLSDALKEKNSIEAEEFYDIVTELGCQTVSTRKKKKSKKEEEVVFDDISTVDLLKTKSKPASEIADNQEEERNYIVYRYYCEDNDIKRVHFTSTHQYHTTIFGQTANLYTLQEAKELIKYFGEGMPYNWFWLKTPKPNSNLIDNKSELKKEIAYALCDYLETDEPSYYCETDDEGSISANLYIYRNHSYIQVFRTQEEAEFYHKVWITNHPNKAEMHIREITF